MYKNANIYVDLENCRATFVPILLNDLYNIWWHNMSFLNLMRHILFLYGIVNQAMGLLQTNTKPKEEERIEVAPSAAQAQPTQAQPTQAQQSSPPVQSCSCKDSSEHVYSGYTKVKCTLIFIRWMFFIKILE